MNKIILFIDDLRKPNKYVDCENNKVFCCLTYDDFVTHLKYVYHMYRKVDEVWFDNDLGDGNGSGYDCAKYLVFFCEENNMPFPEYHIQSANPVAKKYIESYISSYLKSLTL